MSFYSKSSLRMKRINFNNNNKIKMKFYNKNWAELEIMKVKLSKKMRVKIIN
jgi:hypothetical protein